MTPATKSPDTRSRFSKFLQLVFLVGLGFGVGRLFIETPFWSHPIKPPTAQPTPRNESPVKGAGHSAQRSTLQTRKVITVQPTPTSENPYAGAAQGTILEFKVIDGLAIAQGDIILGRVGDDFKGEQGRTEVLPPLPWESREIAYLIHPELPNPKRVQQALEVLQTQTRLRFVPHTQQQDAIVFEPGTEHCLSTLGRVGGLQPIRLSPGCQSQEVLHEILHALGLFHEQSRPDRDQWVEVVWNEIESKYHPQFAKMPEVYFTPFRDLPFDLQSVMFYSPNAFAIHPGAVTLRSRNDQPIAPITEGLSAGDIQKLNRLY
jgi:hypothetical protein